MHVSELPTLMMNSSNDRVLIQRLNSITKGHSEERHKFAYSVLKLNYFCVLCMRHTCVFHFGPLSFPRIEQIRSPKKDICIKLTEKRNGYRSSSQYLNYG